MAPKVITVVDYGFGNVRSVMNALERCGFEAKLVSEAREVEKATSIVLPGVGAFASAMRAIREARLDVAIRESASRDARILGICLGMQLLFERSLEFGDHSGLGILSGNVGPVVSPLDVSPHAKSTHIDWKEVTPKNSGRLSRWFLTNPHQYYFVHSFVAQAVPQAAIAGVSSYLSSTFVAAVEVKNVAGVQFHPERSGPEGLGLLQYFFGEDSKPAQ